MARGNVSTVVSFEVIRTLRTKVFWVGSLLGPLLMVFIMVVVSLSSASASDSSSTVDQSFRFEWVDHSGLVDSSIAEAAGGTEVLDAAQGVADVRAGTVDAFFEFPANPVKDPIQVSAQDQGVVNSQSFSGVAAQVLRASASVQVGNTTLITLVSGNIPTTLTTYKDGQQTPGIWGAIPPLAFIALFFIIVIMQGNRMLAATLEEKENRVTEMILTTIKPTALLTGKVIALGVIGLIQALAMAVLTVIAAVVLMQMGAVASIDLSKLVFQPVPLIFGALILIGGFLLFTSSLVAIGAAMPTVRDAQGMYATVMLLLVIPIYVVMFTLTQPSNPVVVVCTFFPWTSPMVAMALNALGVLPWWQSLIVVIILFATTTVVFFIAARLFQYGSVEYSKKLNIRTVLGAKSK
ncbi:MAG: ABC transporter permease [Propionibacteriaceae bacterium]|nr:ABC transporter permease [Propionibacteriaceae bacterium]